MQEVIAFLRQLKDAGLLDLAFVKASLCNKKDVSCDLVSWKSVSMFMSMAQHALQAKQKIADEARERELEAKYEALFLSSQLESWMVEREKTQQLLNTLQRENHSLESELSLLRAQLSSSSFSGNQESPQPLQMIEKYRQDLALEQTRNQILEKEVRILRQHRRSGDEYISSKVVNNST